MFAIASVASSCSVPRVRAPRTCTGRRNGPREALAVLRVGWARHATPTPRYAPRTCCSRQRHGQKKQKQKGISDVPSVCLRVNTSRWLRRLCADDEYCAVRRCRSCRRGLFERSGSRVGGQEGQVVVVYCGEKQGNDTTHSLLCRPSCSGNPARKPQPNTYTLGRSKKCPSFL